MAPNKPALRQRLIQARQAMTAQETKTLSTRVIHRLINQIVWDSVRTVHVYKPLPLYAEIDTNLLISYIRDNHPTIAIATWHKSGETYTARWLANEVMPADQQFDVIIVPLLGFSDTGHRIGYGGGFYDRFLASQPQATTIGLCYEFGKCSFTSEPHDIPLHHVVTELTTYSFCHHIHKLLAVC